MFFEHIKGVKGLGCQRFITLFIIFKAKKIRDLIFSKLEILSTTLITQIIDINALISYGNRIELTHVIEKHVIAKVFAKMPISAQP